jgi:ASC-1-like (ASCH) protein
MKHKKRPTTMMSIHCEDPWFSLVRDGVKTVEGRKGTHSYKKIKVGDFLNFTNGMEGFVAEVTDVRSYTTLEEYLEDVTVEKALPGVKTMEEALTTYRQWSTDEQIKAYGFLGIFVTPL